MYDPELLKTLTPLISLLSQSSDLSDSLEKLAQKNAHTKSIDNALKSFPDVFKHDLEVDLFKLMCLVQTCAQSMVFQLEKETSYAKRLPTWVLENQAIRMIVDSMGALSDSKKQSLNALLCNHTIDYALKKGFNQFLAVSEHIAKASVLFGLDDAQMYDVCRHLAFCRALVKTSLQGANKEPNKNLRLKNHQWMATHLNVFVNVEKNLKSVYKGHKAFSEILNRVGSNETKSQEACYLMFFKNIHHILAYIKNQHVKMLEHYRLFEDKESECFTELHKNIRKVMLTVISFGARNTNNHENFISFYEKELNENSLALRNFNVKRVRRIDNLYVDFETLNKAGIKVYRDLCEFLQDELQHFRRDYLVRFSKEKLLSKAKQRTQEYKSSSTDGYIHPHLQDTISKVLDQGYEGDVNDEDAKLLQLTAFHGTNSTLLANLSKTDYHLVPSIKARKFNITPFSGEIREGAGEQGVNSYAISSVPLADVNLATRYSRDFHFQYSSYRRRFEFALNFFDGLAKKQTIFTKIEDLYTNDGRSWINLAMDMERAIVLQNNGGDLFNEQEWQAIMTDKLPPIANKIQADFEAFQQTPLFKGYMPAEKVPGGLNDCKTLDYYRYWDLFVNARSAVNALVKLVDFKPSLLTDYEIELLKSKCFGLIVSTDSYAQGLNGLSESERLIVSDLHFGTHIKAAFVEPANVELLEQHLSTLEIKDVKVYSQETLTRLHTHEAVLSPYFADILSKKKLKAILQDNATHSTHIRVPSKPLKPVNIPGNLVAMDEERMHEASTRDYIHLKGNLLKTAGSMSLMTSLAFGAFSFASPIFKLGASVVSGLTGGALLYKVWKDESSNLNLKSYRTKDVVTKDYFGDEFNADNDGYLCGLKADNTFEYAKSFMVPAAYSPQYYLALRHAACLKQQPIENDLSRPGIS